MVRELLDIDMLTLEKVIISGLKTRNRSYLSGDNISNFVTESEKEKLIVDAAVHFQKFLDCLLIDTKNDPNTNETAMRVSKMYFNELFKGRYLPKPDIKTFPNTKKYDQIYLVGPIEIKSTCAHHFQPIVGNCWVGVFPGDEVLGLSKFNRIVEWVASRPQIQEDLTEQIGDELDTILKAQGLAVVIKASHFCVTQRGVKAPCSDMTTSVVRGLFRTEQNLKSEFFELLKGMKGYL